MEINEVKEGGEILLPEPIKTPREVILEVIKEEVKNQKKAERLADALLSVSEELRLIKFFAEEDLAESVKKEFGGAVLLRISNFPARNALFFEEPTLYNVREYLEAQRKENRLAFVKKLFEDGTGIQVLNEQIPDRIKDLLTKNR